MDISKRSWHGCFLTTLSDRVIATEGLPDRQKRTHVLVQPSLNLIGYRFSSNIPITVTNTFNHRVIISKGTEITIWTDEFCLIRFAVKRRHIIAGEKFLPMYFEFEFRKGHPCNKCHFSWVEPTIYLVLELCN